MLTNNLEQIFVNNILEVGYNSSQLTYYGIPVMENDEVNLNISSSNRSLNALSVTVSVYEAEEFSQFLYYTSQNTDPLSRYNLDSCLLTTGCVVQLEAELDGWLHVVWRYRYGAKEGRRNMGFWGALPPSNSSAEIIFTLWGGLG